MDVREVSEIIKLLQGKNRCLQRFLDSSRSFLAAAEDGDVSGLDWLQARRDSILRAMDLFDRKIAQTIALLPESVDRKDLARRAAAELDEGERLTHEILTADDRILSRVATERDRLAQELASSRKAQITISKFKSSWIQESGEEIDSKL